MTYNNNIIIQNLEMIRPKIKIIKWNNSIFIGYQRKIRNNFNNKTK